MLTWRGGVIRNAAASLCKFIRFAAYAATALFTLHSALIYADSQHCDQELKPIDGPLGYQWRSGSDVCEGLYESDISASFELISYLIGELDFEVGTDDVLRIAVDENLKLEKQQVSVRAVTRLIGDYFRMDTALVAPAHVDWSLDSVVIPEEITASELGVFGWIESDYGKVFVPLRVSPKQKHAIDNRQPMELLIRPTVDLEFIEWSVQSDIDSEKAQTGEIFKGAQAGWPFSIIINRGPQSTVEVALNVKPVNSEGWQPYGFRVMRVP